jgi:hypothetical protein
MSMILRTSPLWFKKREPQYVPEDSKLLIVEIIVPPGNQPSIAKLLDLEMLVTTGGQERTEYEYKTLLESSGYHITRIVSTKESVSVIEARPF